MFFAVKPQAGGADEGDDLMALLRQEATGWVVPQALVLQEQRCGGTQDLASLLRGQKQHAGGAVGTSGAAAGGSAGGAQDLASLLRGQKPQAGGADEGDDLMALLRYKKPQAGGGAAGAGATGAAGAGGAQDLASLLRGQKPQVQTRLMT